MNRKLDSISKLRAIPPHHPVARMVLKRQRHLIVPHPNHHPSLWQGKLTPDSRETWYWLGNTNDIYWRQGNHTTTPTCLTSASHGGHGLWWQIWPNRSSSDWPWLCHPVLSTVIIRRRTELGWGARCCIHTVGCYQLGQQTSPAQCQIGKSGWWLAV